MNTKKPMDEEIDLNILVFPRLTHNFYVNFRNLACI